VTRKELVHAALTVIAAHGNKAALTMEQAAALLDEAMERPVRLPDGRELVWVDGSPSHTFRAASDA